MTNQNRTVPSARIPNSTRARLYRLSRLSTMAGTFVVLAVLFACISERPTGTTVDLTGCDVRLPSEAFGSTLVIIRNFEFTPAQVRVRPGTKVTWVNCGVAGTEDAHTSTANAGAWSSPSLDRGATYTRSFAATGVFPYHCEPHPQMIGTVTVE